MSNSATGTGLAFRRADVADADAIAALVNSAYRGDSSRAGWTTEADLLGGQRTDAQEISQLIARECSALLLCLRSGELVGSVHVERVDDATAYLGMLVIRPVLQGAGLGRLLMAEAERFVRSEWGAKRIQMQVITLRTELIGWYERRGYRRSGELRPFPYGDARFGLPKVMGLEFEVLEKPLD
ncbi:MAG: GNAT family N-acetyltransferase [Gammaproteobacteria bacterium]|nr:GNAT family N-acetyltransferase [Gammaproteobacteria bacterium]MBU1777516.1 GNAT family N-acetyltransferase [Gammaproteobacteria bacterium]MBU1967696.1 GNAT family N-acetyltransferase [Gammaproteobacteria bacterium]